MYTTMISLIEDYFIGIRVIQEKTTTTGILWLNKYEDGINSRIFNTRYKTMKTDYLMTYTN